MSPHLEVNLTNSLGRVGNPVWILEVAKSIAAAVSCAVSIRTSAHARRISESDRSYPWDDWDDTWCGFLCSLESAVRLLPKAAFVASALNTSAAAVVREELPQALAPVLGGLARGGFQVLDNASLVFMEYIDYAVLLGEEDLRFGSQRVSRAVFHGDASNAGYSEALLHRSHVLGWLLEGGELGLSGAHRMEAPVMLEVGVNVGQLATALLRSHSRLRWFGVDPYLGDIWTPGGTSFPARDVLKLAKEHLAPFDGRARLFVAPSLALDPHNVGVGPAPLDMLFVDGLHDEESALADLAKWAPLVRTGGIVAGHDYRSGYKGVVRAAHASLPESATLHLAPDGVFWWRAGGVELT